MKMVRRLPCNWKRIDDGDLIGTVEYALVEPMRRAGCRGEVRWRRLVSRDVGSLGNRRGVMMMIAYLTPSLPLPRLCRHCCLPVLGEKQREGKGEGAGEKRRKRSANYLHRRRRSSPNG